MPQDNKIWKEAPRAPCKKHGALGAYAVKSVVAAAGKQNDGNDDQPKGTVIKKIAEAVIHKSFLPKIDQGTLRCSSVTIVCQSVQNVQENRCILPTFDSFFRFFRHFKNALWTNVEEYQKNAEKEEKYAQKSKKV